MDDGKCGKKTCEAKGRDCPEGYVCDEKKRLCVCDPGCFQEGNEALTCFADRNKGGRVHVCNNSWGSQGLGTKGYCTGVGNQAHCACDPECSSDAKCGDDNGCNGKCDGECEDGKVCVEGSCTDAVPVPDEPKNPTNPTNPTDGTSGGSMSNTDECKPDCTNKACSEDNGCNKGVKCGCPSGLICALNKCVAPAKDTPAATSAAVKCVPGEKKCALDESAVLQCNTAGTGWSESTPCLAGCAGGKCVEQPQTVKPQPIPGCATFTGIKNPGDYECTLGIPDSLDKCELVSGSYQWKQYACSEVAKPAAIDYCNSYCGGTEVTAKADAPISGCVNLGQPCSTKDEGHRACDCGGHGYFDLCSSLTRVWSYSAETDRTCLKPAATNTVNTVSKVFKCLKADGKTFAKAGDACDTSWAGSCGWDGANHCYCKDDGTFAFNNNLADYCKKCMAREIDTNVCSCADITKSNSWVKMGGRVCGTGKTQNISFLCKTPGEAMVEEPCVNGGFCNKDGCGEEKTSCSDLTDAIADVIEKINSGVAHFASQSKASAKFKYHASSSSGYWADSQKMADEINVLEKNGVFQNVKNKAAKFKDPAKFDIACTSPQTVPWCSEQNKQVYRCVEGPIKNAGCYVWDWVMGGGDDCTKNSAGDYCQYEKKETLNSNGDVTGSEYVVDKATGKRNAVGKCAMETKVITFPLGNKIVSHVLGIQGTSLTEKLTTDSKPDYCTADCYFCEGAGCAIGSRLLASTKLNNISSNIFSADYTVKTIMGRNAASFQCTAQCWNGEVETAAVKSNAVSTAAPAPVVAPVVAPVIKKMMEIPIGDLYTCLFFKSSCTVQEAEVLLEYYDCRSSSACGQYQKVVVESSDLAELKARIEKCAKTPDSSCTGGSSTGTTAASGTSFSAGSTTTNLCNATDKNGAKLTGAKCAADGKCYYAARGQACGGQSIVCQATVNKSLYQCFGNVVKSLAVTADGLDCDYLKTVQTCASNQKCDTVSGACK